MIWTVFLIPVAALISVFTFVSVAVWAESRRREREEFYRHETYQKMLERSAESAETVSSLIREEEARRELRRIEGTRRGLVLGGWITLVTGFGLAIFLYQLIDNDPVFLAALMPIFVGVVLVAYGYFMRPRVPHGESGPIA